MATIFSLVGMLSGCAPTAAPPTNSLDRDPEAVARSLIDATKTICIPYVVDGTPIERLVRRAGIAKRIVYVNWVPVTEYAVNAPGQVVVTPAPGKEVAKNLDGTPAVTDTSCVTNAEATSTPAFAEEVYRRFRNELALEGRKTTAPHLVETSRDLRFGPPASLDIVCVLGRTPALVRSSNPRFKMPPNSGFANMDEHNEAIDIVVNSHEDSEGCP
jgi:hypothetical protein